MTTCRLILSLALTAVWSAPFASATVRAGEADKPDAPICLLTGFEPFGGLKTNASWEMLKPLDGQTVAGYRIATARLPVVYDEMAGPLLEAIAKHRPAIVICFGVGTSVVQIETTAHNGYHSARPKDNAGRQPPREKIVPGGKDTLLTQLPVAETRRALQLAGIGATTSEDAGGYLCNECFYRLMALDGEQARGIKRRGFVHVPMVGVKDPEGGAFGLEKLERAVRIIIEQTARAAQ